MHTASQKARARARTRAAETPLEPGDADAPLELAAGDVIAAEAEEAPFEPPPLDDIFGLEDCEDEEELVFEDDAPFDPPEPEPEPVFIAPVQIAPPPKPAPAKPEPAPELPRDRPVPAISVFAAYDRPESQALFAELAADPRLARAEFEIARGGIDAALNQTADLYLLETTLERSAMLAALDRLRANAPRARIVILGDVNDIALLRDLAARNVSDYIVPPTSADSIARSLCALFADSHPARIIAVIGARGGIGASTIAQNIAWSIAERQQRRTMLADLDLSFGSAANNFRQTQSGSTRDVLDAEDVEETLIRCLAAPTARLRLLPAPAKTDALDVECDAFARLFENLRRSARYVVLDLPHAWEPWVRDALREADEVVIVAGPDLASLRNADNMLKLLRSERDKPSAPKVVLSMCGLPKRPEIPLKDFAQALKAEPVMSFGFEPELFAGAESDGQMIYEAMPDSKAALQLDTLATLLTGHEPIARPEARAKAAPEKSPEPLPVLDLVTPAPIEQPPCRRRRERRKQRSGFVALQTQAPTQKRRSTGLIRTLAAVAALVAVGVWYAGEKTSNSPQEAGSAFSA